MAATESPNSQETLHFLLSDGPNKTSVPCSLTLDIDTEDAPLVSRKEDESCHITFKIGTEHHDEENALKWIDANLKECSIQADENQGSNVIADEKVQAMVKNMAALWAESLKKKQLTYIARPTTASSGTSSQSSSSVSDTIFDTRSEASISSPPAVLDSIATRRGGKNYGAFYLDIQRPGTPSTAPTTPISSELNLGHRRSNLDDILISRISTLEWERVQRNDPVTRDLISPTRPSDIYRPPGRTPSIHSHDPSSPESSRPASPTVAVQAHPSTPVIVQSARDDTEIRPESGWWSVVLDKAEINSDPITAIVPAEKLTIVLPSPPTDSEKYVYAQTRRAPLYIFGTFSFLSVSVGMWFFAISSSMFYWFGVFVGLIQVYLTISYVVGYCGRDFNIEEYKKLVEEHTYTENFPLVDVYLPCCKEPIEVLANTYKYVSQLKYPNYKVYVLDDGGFDSVKQLAAQYKFNYISRDNKPHLKKAGNLRYAFARTKGDFFAIFDADFCPRDDFLDAILPYMKKHEDIAIVQSPQFFRPCKEQTWVEQGASSTQELFYRIVQVNRDRWGAAICVGSNAVYRRAALEEVGGTAEIGHSEDVHTGFYAINRGWKLKYIPLALACGVSPDTPQAFFSQQMRWCSGSTTLLSNPEFWKSRLTIIQKVCYLSGMMYYTAAGLMIFLVPIPGLLMLWLNPDLVMWFNFAYAFPSLIYSVVIFRLWSRQMYNFNVNFVYAIQQYAYFMAVKDRIFGTTASWVPSGDNSSHIKGKKKAGGNNKYRNMRILCCVWVWGTTGAMIAGVSLRIVQGYHWYNFFPLFILDGFNVFTCFKFIFCSR